MPVSPNTSRISKTISEKDGSLNLFQRPKAEEKDNLSISSSQVDKQISEEDEDENDVFLRTTPKGQDK